MLRLCWHLENGPGESRRFWGIPPDQMMGSDSASARRRITCRFHWTCAFGRNARNGANAPALRSHVGIKGNCCSTPSPHFETASLEPQPAITGSLAHIAIQSTENLHNPLPTVWGEITPRVTFASVLRSDRLGYYWLLRNADTITGKNRNQLRFQLYVALRLLLLHNDRTLC